MNYWLFKSEPESFSIDDLQKAPKQTTFWNGVRNYQARNFLRDSIKVGDRVLFYHSNADPTAIVGTATVVKAGYPDHSAWDKKSDYYDESASPDNPIWQMVDIRFEQKFPRPVPLDELRTAKELTGMELLRRGSRLSIQPVSEKHFQAVLKMANASPAKKKK